MEDVAVLVGDRVAAFELGILCQVFGLDRFGRRPAQAYDLEVCGVQPGPLPATYSSTSTVPYDVERAR